MYHKLKIRYNLWSILCFSFDINRRKRKTEKMQWTCYTIKQIICITGEVMVKQIKRWIMNWTWMKIHLNKSNEMIRKMDWIVGGIWINDENMRKMIVNTFVGKAISWDNKIYIIYKRNWREEQDEWKWRRKQ